MEGKERKEKENEEEEGSDARRKTERKKKKKEMAMEGRRELRGERETSTRIKTTCFWKLGPEIKKSGSLGGNGNTKWSRYQFSKIT